MGWTAAIRWETSLVATKAQMMKNRGSCTPKYMSPGIGTRVHTTPYHCSTMPTPVYGEGIFYMAEY
jgi:hypothetical protein